MRRLLLIISGLLILFAVAVPIAAVYYAVFTESGLQFVVRQIPHKVGGVRLDIVNVKGTIASGISAERVEIDHRLVHLRFEGIQGRVHLLPLLWQTIHSTDAVIHSTYIEVKRRTRPPDGSPPFFLPHWMLITSDHLRLDDAVLVVPNGTRLEWTNLSGAGVVRPHTIRLYQAEADMGTVHVSAIGRLRAHDPLQIDADGKLTWKPSEDLPVWEIASTAHGDLDKLAVTGRFLTPFSADVSGQMLTLTNNFHWVAQSQVHSFDLRAWKLNGPLGILTGQLALHGESNRFFAQGTTIPAGLKAGVFDVQFAGSYADRVLTAEHYDIVHHSSGAHASGSGTIGIIPKGPQLDFKGTYQNFRWPLVGKDVPFRSPSGEYTLAGVLPYAVTAKGIAAITDLTPFPVTLTGTLGKDGFSYHDTLVEAFDGHGVLDGEVTWAPADTWLVNGNLTGVDPRHLRPDLPGSLNFSVSARGRGFKELNDFTVEVRNLSGKLRGVAASGGGKLQRTPTDWQFQGIRMVFGRTNIALDGSVDDELDLRFGIKTEDLSLLSAGSRGQLEASGTVRGSMKDPTVAAKAHATDIDYEGVQLAALDADIDFDPRGQHESKVVAHLHNLQYAQRTFDDLALTVAGQPSRLDVHLKAATPGLAVDAHGAGPYSGGVWDGKLENLTITGNESLHLELEQPVGLLVAADHVRADWMCLSGKPASLCTDAQWSPSKWAATLEAKDLPMSTLTSGLTPAVEYSGRINVMARLFAAGSDPTQGTVRMDLIDAHLIHKLSSGKKDNTTLGSGQVSVNASRTTIAAEVGLDAGNTGAIKGSLTAQRSQPDWQNMPIEGEFHAHTGQLDLITLYAPDIDKASGTLDADMKIRGTLGTPLIIGTVKVANGSLDIYQVNLGMRQLGFEARLTDNGLEFDGSTNVGQGTAKAHGNLEWRNSLPYGKFHLEGAGLRVVDVPEAQINASPDLDFNIDGRRIEVTGTVKVPYAKIAPAEIKGAVLSSSDEVIVGAEPKDPAKRLEVMSTITMSLGDKVSIETSGLSGRLLGNVTVRSGYDELTRATGELSIAEGKYLAYARKLDIRRGRLIFSGGSVQDPGIDLQAVKEYPDVTAGVNVRGTLQQPRMSFFSDPSLPQSQIVSLILSGGGLDTVQNQKSGAGNEALAQGGALLAQQIGSRIGFEDVSLETDLTNETSLVLGKFLSPRLYVSYGVSLAEQFSTLKLRYTLGKHWTIKTEVGQYRGADLVFTIEK